MVFLAEVLLGLIRRFDGGRPAVRPATIWLRETGGRGSEKIEEKRGSRHGAQAEISQEQLAMTLKMTLALKSSNGRSENIRNSARNEVAGRQGVTAAAFRDLQKQAYFQANSHLASQLRPQHRCQRFRRFAPVFGFCRRNGTRREPLRKMLARKTSENLCQNLSTFNSHLAIMTSPTLCF